MAKQRSEEDLLHRLDTIHLRGGRSAFKRDLADICASRIGTFHLEIFEKVMSDARGLKMTSHARVRATRRHIAGERLRLRKLRKFAVASGSGHALMC